MKNLTRVEIHDLNGSCTNVYIAKNESECLDNVDLEAYRIVVRFGDIVTIGKVIARPLWD